MDRAHAVDLLSRAPVVHLATTLPDGAPLLRTVNGVVVDDAIAFHGAPAGEKTLAVGRPAVLSSEEIVASIPSYFVDPERACPATTLYRSVQVHGVLEAVDDPQTKARVLSALMVKFQPEGGYVPIDPTNPLYRRTVEGLLIVRVALERLDGRAKLAQNRRPEERTIILEKLWARGLPGDPAAIEAIRAANPDTPTPSFLRAPAGTSLVCALDTMDADAAAALLVDEYWNVGISAARIAVAQRGSGAWVGARDERGNVIATARALSDAAKAALVYDVIVASAWRRRGLGHAMMRLLLDHPAVRGASRVRLDTRDGQNLYRQFGFVEARELPPTPYPSTPMVLVREPL